MLVRSQEPRPGLPRGCRVPRVGRPRLLSRATGRELEGKRDCRDRTGAHMGSWACKARTLTTAPLRRALIYFFKDLFLLESQIYREERERGRSSVLWFTPQEAAMARTAPNRSQEPGASSGSPTWVQGPKALGHPWLLSQATGRELEGKRGCRDRTGAHMGSQACKARTLTTAPLRHRARPQARTFL